MPAALRADYERDGFVVVRRLFEPHEMRAARAEADRLLVDFARLKDARNMRCRWQNNVFTGECTFETFDPVINLSPVCARRA